MKQTTRKTLLRVIIVLALIGFVTSLYLIYNHYAPPGEGAFCDFGEKVNCSLVNTSIYSELFSVPVALFGAIWLVIVILLSWKIMEGNEKLITGLLAWSLVGIAFVVYMIIAEIILGAICPFCTLVHIITLITLLLSALLYRAQEVKPKLQSLIETAKPWLVAIVIINIIPLILFNLPAREKVNYDALTQCLTEKGVVMYSSYICSNCRATIKKFGDSFQYIDMVECHPRGPDPQADLCLEKSITHTPTWMIEKDGVEVKRLDGYQRPETLAEFADCPMEEKVNG